MKSQSNILLVDDQPENLLYLETILEETDQCLIKAGSGEEAFKVLQKQDIDLILKYKVTKGTVGKKRSPYSV